jgi:hypothetical protein
MSDVNISKFRAQVVRDGSKPATPGFVVSEGQSPTDPAGTGQNHLPVTIAPAATALSITESQILGGAGTVGQYIRGDGSLADFPAATGGGSSVSYYLNGSVSQGTIGGVAYREVNRNPVFGAGTDITRNSNGYIANFITDAGDPNKLEIPAGNWNFETYFSASSGGGSPTFYVELYKYDGTTFTLIATSSGTPELIAFGTNINPYFSTLAVPQTVLTLTDRLALRYYVNTSGRTITLHTENGHLCQVITTFTTGLTALNGLTSQVQFFAVGTSGTDFAISSATDTHTFNLPTASATNRGALSSADWTTFNGKENAITAGTTAQYFRGDKTFQTLNTSIVPELTNLYYTEARVNANTNVAANTAARHNAVTLGTANGLSLSTQVLSLGLASAGVTGALSGTDWNTFNSKQNALTNPVTGTGSAGQVAYWSSSSAITGESNLFWDSTNDRLGIGTNSPSFGLDIQSNVAANAYLRVLFTGFAETFIQSFSNGGYIGTSNNYPLFIRTNNTTHATLTSGGNLLVGTTTDAGFKLDVNGTGRFSGVLTTNSGTNSTNGIQIISSLSSSLFTGGIEFIRTTVAGGSKVQPLRDAAIGGVGLSFLVTANNTAEVNATYTSAMAILNNGNVGIGTSSPTSIGGYIIQTINGTSGSFTEYQENATNTFRIGSDVGLGGFLYTQGSLGIRFGTAGSERARITSGGNLLVGTTTDAGFRLDVNGTGRFTSELNALQLNTRSASGSAALLLKDNSSNNKWEIGHVSNSLYFYNYTTGTNPLVITGSTGAATFSSSAFNVATFNSTFGQMAISFANNGTTFSQIGSGVSVCSTAAADDLGFGTAGLNKSIVFATGTGYLERLRITSGGNVGINISSPTTYSLSGSHIENFGGSNFAFIHNNTTTVKSFYATNESAGLSVLYTFSAHPLTFGTSNTERMRITSGGNVLIGTTTDVGAKLYVNGGIRTANPTGSTSNDWLLGRALTSGTSSPDRWIRVQIGNLYYDILAVYMGSV